MGLKAVYGAELRLPDDLRHIGVRGYMQKGFPRSDGNGGPHMGNDYGFWEAPIADTKDNRGADGTWKAIANVQMSDAMIVEDMMCYTT